MKKKLIPIVALTSVLGITGLASCKQDNDTPVEPTVEHHHHYGILTEAPDGVTVSVAKEAESGKDVTVTVALPDDTQDEISAVTAGEGVTVKPGTKAGTYTFTMPTRTVTVKVETTAIKHKVTVTDPDATKGTMKIYNTDGTDATASPAGTVLVAKYTATDTTKAETNVKLGDAALAFDPTVGGYKFTVGTADTTLTYDLGDPHPRFYIPTAIPGYEVSVKDDGENPAVADETGVYVLTPGTMYSVELNKAADGATNITLATLKGTETVPEIINGKVMFWIESMPTTDIVLTVEYENVDTINIRYNTVGVTLGACDNWGDPIPGGKIPSQVAVGSTITFLAQFENETDTVDPVLSGVYDADGNREELMIDEFGVVSYEVLEDKDIEIRVFAKSGYDASGLTGRWGSKNFIRGGSIVSSSQYSSADSFIQIQSDGSFTFAPIEREIKETTIITGTLTEDGGDYTWTDADTAEDDVTSIKVRPHADDNDVIKYIQLDYEKGTTEHTYFYTQGQRSEIIKDTASYKKGERLYYLNISTTEGTWLVKTEFAYKETTITESVLEGDTTVNKNITGDDLVFNHEYSIKDGFSDVVVKYDGEGLIRRDKHFGEYQQLDEEGTLVPESEPIALDGYGNASQGQHKGTYEYQDLTGVYTITLNGLTKRYTKDTTGETAGLKLRTPDVKDELSGLTYKVTDGITLAFIDRDTVSFTGFEKTAYSFTKSDKGIDGTIAGTKKEESGKINFKIGTDYTISFTGVYKDTVFTDIPKKTDILVSAFDKTFTLKDGTELDDKLVLTGGLEPTFTLGDGQPQAYTITKDAETGIFKVVSGGREYTLDLTASTYDPMPVDVSWVNAANAAYEVGSNLFVEAGEIGDYEYITWEDMYADGNKGKHGTSTVYNNIEMKFSEDGSKIASMKIVIYKITEAADYSVMGGGLEPPKINVDKTFTLTDCTYVLDGEALTLTVTLNDVPDGGTLVFNIDATTKTLVTTKGTITRPNPNNLQNPPLEYKVGAGIVIKPVVAAPEA